ATLPSWRRMQDRCETNRTGVVQRIPIFRESGRAAAQGLFPQGRNFYRPADLSASARRAGAGDAPCPAASVCGFALYGVFPSVLLSEVMRGLARTGTSKFPLWEETGERKAGCRVYCSLPNCREPKRRPRLVYLLPAIAPAVAAATIAATTVATTTEAAFAGLGFIHLDVAPLEFGFVKVLDRLGCLVRTSHLDKAEALRLAGELVRDNGGALHLTRLRK